MGCTAEPMARVEPCWCRGARVLRRGPGPRGERGGHRPAGGGAGPVAVGARRRRRRRAVPRSVPRLAPRLGGVARPRPERSRPTGAGGLAPHRLHRSAGAYAPGRLGGGGDRPWHRLGCSAASCSAAGTAPGNGRSVRPPSGTRGTMQPSGDPATGRIGRRGRGLPVAVTVHDWDDEVRHATWLELFFDLVFVAALANLGDLLHHDYSLGGAATAFGLLVPIWPPLRGPKLPLRLRARGRLRRGGGHRGWRRGRHRAGGRRWGTAGAPGLGHGAADRGVLHRRLGPCGMELARPRHPPGAPRQDRVAAVAVAACSVDIPVPLAASLIALAWVGPVVVEMRLGLMPGWPGMGLRAPSAAPLDAGADGQDVRAPATERLG